MRFFDARTKHHVAVKKVKHAGKLRYLAVSYDIIGDNIEIITIHPVPKEDIDSRERSGRWQKE